MTQSVYVNLVVKSSADSTAFYEGLGFTKNEMFSDDSTASIIMSDSLVLMLQEKSKMEEFVTRPVASSIDSVWGSVAFTVDSREEVDRIADKALASGGTPTKDPIDMGFMYNRSFHDPDGHVIEVVWFNPEASFE